jgi:hypothetical protein
MAVILGTMEPTALIPLWLKLSYTLVTAAVIVVYSARNPVGNFLWFSDVALILLVPAIWFENSLLASMMALAVLLPQTVWNIDFFFQLLTGRALTGITEYMFDRSRPAYLRAMSLFHVFMPPLLIYLAVTLGYDPLALPAVTLLGWVVLILSYLLTDPAHNINLVFGPPGEREQPLPPLLYLALLMVALLLLLYLPTHWLLMRWA